MGHGKINNNQPSCQDCAMMITPPVTAITTLQLHPHHHHNNTAFWKQGGLLLVVLFNLLVMQNQKSPSSTLGMGKTINQPTKTVP